LGRRHQSSGPFDLDRRDVDARNGESLGQYRRCWDSTTAAKVKDRITVIEQWD
jgi:hypothetical protein